MRKHSLVLGLGLVGFALMGSGCGIVPGTSSEKVEAGYSGLKIALYGDGKGIENAELVNGKVWYNGYSEDVVTFPTFTNVYTFSDSPDEGTPGDESIPFSLGGSEAKVNVNLAFAFSTAPVEPQNPTYTKLHRFYKNYRKTPDQFRDSVLRNSLSTCFTQAANTPIYPLILANGKTVNQRLTVSTLSDNLPTLTQEVKKCLQAAYTDVSIDRVDIQGQPRLPEAVQKSINEKFASQQAAQTAESNQKKAEAEAGAIVAKAKGDAEAAIAKARGDAEANRLKSASVTPALIELRRLEMAHEAQLARAAKWDGKEAAVVQTANTQVGNPK